MSYLYIFITAITVSLDSFVCGLSLCLKSNSKIKIISGISSVVFILCITAGLFGQFLAEWLNKYCEFTCGIILILIAVCDFFTQKKEKTKNEKNIFKTSVIIGFAVGLDGACACLSLTLIYHKPVFLACIFTAFHLLFISASFLFVKKSFKFFTKCNYAPPVILFILGIYKIICFFKF